MEDNSAAKVFVCHMGTQVQALMAPRERNPGVVVNACFPITWEGKGGLWGFLDSWSPIQLALARVRNPISKNKTET